MSSCTLCGLPADSPVTDSDIDGEFCCQGCLEVSRTLGDVDPAEIRRDQESSTETEIPDGAETAYLAVEGMHCSTCELFLESVARERAGVYDVSASYAAEAIKVVYDPAEIDEQTIRESLSGRGYRVRSRQDDEQETSGEDIASRLLVGGLFSMMAMTWYAIFLYPTYFGYEPVVSLGTFDAAYLYAQLAVVTAIVLLYTGKPMLRGAYVSLQTRQPNVDLLVSIAALAAYGYSTGRLFLGGADLYYDVTIVVVMAVTIGNYYEDRIKRKTAGLLSDLTAVQVDKATRRDGETVPIEAVDAGDKLLVKPGERIPVDGTIVEGTAAIDEALVTGESIPEQKGSGQSVRGGTVVTDQPIVVEAGPEATSTLDRLVGLLWEIQANRPGAQRVADRLATVFVPLVLSLAVLIAIGTLVTGSTVETAVLTALTVLIVACPCALGLATPLAVATGLQSAANRGIVIANAELFETAPAVDTVVFDKTGTLTTGEMTVTDTHAVDCEQAELLERASTLEQYSTHPIARAVVTYCDGENTGQSDRRSLTDGGTTAPAGTERPATDGVETIEPLSLGVSGEIDGQRTVVGHPDLFTEGDWYVPEQVSKICTETESIGSIPVVVGWGGVARGVLTVADRRRKGWKQTLQDLGGDHRIVVLTGDDESNTGWLDEHPAVDDVFAGVPSDGKTETIRRLAGEGTVAMVGDGRNDAPALAAADVGISLESGTQLASKAADAIVLESDLERVPTVFDAVARTNKRITENIAWAFVYNGIAIPLAVIGVLNPLFAAVAMATSSLFVVANSAR